MASIQDPLTDLPPPSRLDLDELSNFAVDLSPPPRPSLSWSPHVDAHAHSRPRLLLIASSPAGLHLIRHLTGKVHLGSVVISGDDEDAGSPSAASFSDDGNVKGHSIYDARNPRKQPAHSCDLYALGEGQTSVVFVAVEKLVVEEGASAWARLLLEAIVADNVVVVSTLQREHFRGRISADDEVIFRLETDRLRSEDHAAPVSLSDVPFFPSGSLVSGLPAAVLSRCQLQGLRARLLLSWPESQPSAASFLAKALKGLHDTQWLDFSSSLRVPFKGKSVSYLDIYM